MNKLHDPELERFKRSHGPRRVCEEGRLRGSAARWRPGPHGPRSPQPRSDRGRPKPGRTMDLRVGAGLCATRPAGAGGACARALAPRHRPLDGQGIDRGVRAGARSGCSSRGGCSRTGARTVARVSGEQAWARRGGRAASASLRPGSRRAAGSDARRTARRGPPRSRSRPASVRLDASAARGPAGDACGAALASMARGRGGHGREASAGERAARARTVRAVGRAAGKGFRGAGNRRPRSDPPSGAAGKSGTEPATLRLDSAPGRHRNPSRRTKPLAGPRPMRTAVQIRPRTGDGDGPRTEVVCGSPCAVATGALGPVALFGSGEIVAYLLRRRRRLRLFVFRTLDVDDRLAATVPGVSPRVRLLFEVHTPLRIRRARALFAYLARTRRDPSALTDGFYVRVGVALAGRLPEPQILRSFLCPPRAPSDEEDVRIPEGAL